MFTVGKDPTYAGFNGQIKGLKVFFGRNFYVDDPDKFETFLSQNFPKPVIDMLDTKLEKLQDDALEYKTDNAPVSREWKDEYQGALEYSIFGWFRYIPVANMPTNIGVLRLTVNEPAYRKEAQTVGDRTLLLML